MDNLRLKPASAALLALSLIGCAQLPPQAPSAAPSPGAVAAVSAPERIVNTLGLPLVRIPRGEFFMGSDEPIAQLEKDFPLMERQRLEELRDEAPVHRVRITKDFYLGQTEVTVGQFRQFLKASGYVPESIADGTGGYGYNPQHRPNGPRGEQFEGRNPRYSWANPGFAQTDAHPVVNVTWNDAQALAKWLSQREGRTYRLPTEAEWEYSARAGTRTRYHHGDNPAGLTAVANVFDTHAKPLWPAFAAHAVPGDDGYAFTAPVASFAPNAFGLYDMHGNAWEWTQDLHDEAYYAKSPVDDPQGPAEGSVYVRRGGSWHTWPLYLRSSYRNWNSPQTRYTLVGIRLLMEAPR